MTRKTTTTTTTTFGTFVTRDRDGESIKVGSLVDVKFPGALHDDSASKLWRVVTRHKTANGDWVPIVEPFAEWVGAGSARHMFRHTDQTAMRSRFAADPNTVTVLGPMDVALFFLNR